jgi:hypothetical protein
MPTSPNELSALAKSTGRGIFERLESSPYRLRSRSSTSAEAKPSAGARSSLKPRALAGLAAELAVGLAA